MHSPICSVYYNYNMSFNNVAQPTAATTPAMVSPREGDTITFTCTATGVPVPSVTWSRADGSSLTDSRYVISNTSSTMIVNDVYQVTRNLTIMNIVRTDMGTMYNCTVTNVVNTVQSNATIISVLCKLSIMHKYYVATYSYGTAEFKLNRTHMQQGHDTFFISHACNPACAHKIGDVKPTMQSSRVHTRRVHDARGHVRNAHAKFALCVHANCKPMTAK